MTESTTGTPPDEPQDGHRTQPTGGRNLYLDGRRRRRAASAKGAGRVDRRERSSNPSAKWSTNWPSVPGRRFASCPRGPPSLTAIAADRAAPLAKRAGEVTADASGKIASKSRELGRGDPGAMAAEATPRPRPTSDGWRPTTDRRRRRDRAEADRLTLPGHRAILRR